MHVSLEKLNSLLKDQPIDVASLEKGKHYLFVFKWPTNIDVLKKIRDVFQQEGYDVHVLYVGDENLDIFEIQKGTIDSDAYRDGG